MAARRPSRRGAETAKASAALSARREGVERALAWGRRRAAHSPRAAFPADPGRHRDRFGAGAVVDDGKPAAGELLQPLGEGAGFAGDRCRRSARRCRLRPCRRVAASSAVAAARRVGANGCGCNAAAVERASAEPRCARRAISPGWQSRAPPRAVLRLGLGDEAVDHARALRPARRGGSRCRPRSRPAAPFSAASRVRLSTGSASAKMSSAAASSRSSISHHGVLAGVFSRDCRPTRMRVGRNSTCRGRGGTVRSSQ